MRKLLVLLLALALGFFTFAFAASLQEVATLSKEVAKDFRTEQQFWDQCKVGNTDVSLAALLYALAKQEGGYVKGSLGDRTNNWGSLHASQGQKPVADRIIADGTRTATWPVYNNPYDGVYEKAYMITHSARYNNCQISYNQLYAYIVGPNTPKSKKHPAWAGHNAGSWVQLKLDQLKNNAVGYDKAGGVTNTPTYTQGPSHNKFCRLLGIVDKPTRIQWDTDEGIMAGEVAINTAAKKIKIFACYD